MEDKSIFRHSLRLNMDNEQHYRIQKVLADLDKDIHKSENQFIINAIDFYISSFEGDGIIRLSEARQKIEYLTKADLEEIRREIKSDVKEDMIRLLGSVVIGSPTIKALEYQPKTKVVDDQKDTAVSDLVNRWG